MTNNQKEAKVDLNGKMKRFHITDNFSEFKQNCEKAYNMSANDIDNYNITYIDDEEDKVIMSNIYDYDQAMLFITNPKITHLRINLEPKNSLLQITEINMTASLNLQELIEPVSLKEDEKTLDFDDLQQEIDEQKKELEEERIRTTVKLEENEGVRESHYNIVESYHFNHWNKEEVEEQIKSSETEDNKIRKNSEEMPFNSESTVCKIDNETLVEDSHKPEEKIDYVLKDEVQLLKKDKEEEKIEINEIEGIIKSSQIQIAESSYYDRSLIERQKEDLLKEKRKLTVMEKIRKRAQEDLIKNNMQPIKEECGIKEDIVNRVDIQDDSKEKEKEIKVENLENSEDKPAENRIVKKEDKKRCHLRRKKSVDPDLNKSFTGDATAAEAELKERISNSTVKFMERKFNKFKEIITSKTIRRTNKIVNKYIEYLNKNKANDVVIKQISHIEIPKKELSIHEDIRCDGCHMKPILGDRYKCSICENFDFCEKCEEENFLKNSNHPHSFIRIRHHILFPDAIQLINPKSSPANVDLPLQIEPKNNFELDSNLFINHVTYSSQCLNDGMDLNYFIDSKENLTKTITLKNNGSISWPKPCFLGCLKEKSTISCLTIPIASKMNPDGEINIEIKFDSEDKKTMPGNYLCYLQLYHTSSKKYFGEEFCVCVNVNEPEHVLKYNQMTPKEKKKYNNFVKNMRESYQISAELYPDSEILKVLLKENGDNEKALMLLLDDSK